MAPVGGLTQLDGRQSGTVEPAITAVGELLQPAKAGFCPGQAGCGLDNPRLGPGFHELYQPGNAVGTEQAVGIQNHHIAVAATPSTQEIRDIAALVVQVDVAPPVEQLLARAELPAYLFAGRLFLEPDFRVPAVREHIEINGFLLSRSFEIADDCFQTAEGALHRFIANGHHDGGRCDRCVFGVRPPNAPGQAPGVAAKAERNKAKNGGPEAHADPGK